VLGLEFSMDYKKGQQIKFMTYNVWRREDVVLYKRMKAISDLVQKHKPDVVFFQVKC
jgi:tyrosyl-DNA phosphodiesterase 2